MEADSRRSGDADGLVAPHAALPRATRGLSSRARRRAGYRVYGVARGEPAPLSRASCARCFGVELTDLAFAARLRREPGLRDAVHTWLAGRESRGLEWEQRKHERLLAA